MRKFRKYTATALVAMMVAGMTTVSYTHLRTVKWKGKDGISSYV